MTHSNYNPNANTYATGQAYPPQPQDWYSHYAHQLSQQDLQQCQQWFGLVDKDRSGNIQAAELAQIQFNNQPIGINVAAKLIKVFDKDGSGSIEFKEYCILHKFMLHMQNAFFQADKDRSGSIDSQEIWTAINAAGFQVSLQTIQAIVNKFDPTKRGLPFSSFLYLCAHLAHIRSIYDWNDQQRRGYITLTYDALCHIGTDILNNIN